MEAWAKGRVLTDSDVPWMIVPKSFRETDKLLKDADGDEAALLGEVQEFLNGFASRLGAK